MALALGLVWRYSKVLSHTDIRDLAEVRVGAKVRVGGVVTFVDQPGRRVWIQDETGALPLDLVPAGIRVGDRIMVSALKTHSFDPARGPVSVGLEDLHRVAGPVRVSLPAPIPVNLDEFPREDKNGIRIQTTGIVREARFDRYGRVELAIAKSGDDTVVTVPALLTPSRYINAEIRVTGVPQIVPNPAPGESAQRLWTASGDDIVLQSPAPIEKLYSVQSANSDSTVQAGYRLRVRGRVLESAGTSIAIQDSFGTMDCELAAPKTFAPGTPVEIAGFPSSDKVRIWLRHAQAHAILESELASAQSSSQDPVLRSVKSVRNLDPVQAARALPVRLKGVITYFDPIWRQMYIDDGSGGIYVKLASTAHARVGARVLLSGVSNPGAFAPVITAAAVHVISRASLPNAITLSSEIAAGGHADAQYVELEGVVRSVKVSENPSHPIVTFDLVSTLGRIHVYTSPDFADFERARELEDARVRMSGVFGSLYNSRRQLVGYQLLIQSATQIEVLDPPVRDPFSVKSTPISNLLRFSSAQRYGHRVNVTGTVTFAQDNRVYVQDETAGVEIQADAGAVAIGESVKAVGYPTPVGRYSPVMTDALLKPLGKITSLGPREMTPESILQGGSDSMLVAVTGRLRAVVYNPDRTTLMLQSGVHTFSARIANGDSTAGLRRLREGSVLRVVGVCSTPVDSNRLYLLIEYDPTNFEILLRSPQDVTVVRPAPFWNPENTLAMLAICAIVLPAGVVWVLILRRRVHRQNAALAKAKETAQAMRDLSRSMQTVTRDKRFDTRVSVRGSAAIARLVVGFNRMLTELQQHESDKLAAEAKLQHMAMIDELTSLPNRRMLFDRLAQSLARAERQQRKLALLYVDLDGFKAVNDSLGHTVGDLLLTEVARRLRSRARSADTLARIGGDEFVLILEDITEVADVHRTARDFVESLEQPFLIGGQSLTISASAGIALYPDHGAEGESLLQHADCAMYAAKNNGKNQVVVFGHALGTAARDRLTLESELRRAVAENVLTVEYQPEFDLETGEAVRFEALARWNHPTLGSIPPAQFIPIAEESGLIIPLGARVMAQACAEAHRWMRQTGREIQVAVNVSSVQFARESFLEDISETLRRSGLPARLLQIELTESVHLTGFDRSRAVLCALKEMGVSIAIDDFGTGYSCLSYLPRLPFDAVKIDRSFVNEHMVDADSAAFLRSVIEMAHNLRMRVIVEGIESPRELQAFADLGADEAQGYLLGRPTPDPDDSLRSAPDILAMLQAIRTDSIDMQDTALDTAILDA